MGDIHSTNLHLTKPYLCVAAQKGEFIYEEEKKKSRAKVFFDIRKRGGANLKRRREKSRRRTGESFFLYFYFFFSPPLAPAFGPSHIQKWSRARISTLILGRTSYSRLLSRLLALLPSVVVFLFSVQVESKVKMNESQSWTVQHPLLIQQPIDPALLIQISLVLLLFLLLHKFAQVFLILSYEQKCVFAQIQSSKLRSRKVKKKSDWTKKVWNRKKKKTILKFLVSLRRWRLRIILPTNWFIPKGCALPIAKRFHPWRRRMSTTATLNYWDASSQVKKPKTSIISKNWFKRCRGNKSPFYWREISK